MPMDDHFSELLKKKIETTEKSSSDIDFIRLYNRFIVNN